MLHSIIQEGRHVPAVSKFTLPFDSNYNSVLKTRGFRSGISSVQVKTYYSLCQILFRLLQALFPNFVRNHKEVSPTQSIYFSGFQCTHGLFQIRGEQESKHMRVKTKG